jgi:toxin-antitoxin system PIN domain toxin
MQSPDVNVLIYAFRSGAPEHARARLWLEDLLTSGQAFALSSLVLSGFLRIVTNRQIFDPPVPLDAALSFVDALRAAPGSVILEPGPRHWDLFRDLCQRTNATANRIPDAYLAALAIESGSEWITTDRGFGRYPGLRWSHPFQ